MAFLKNGETLLLNENILKSCVKGRAKRGIKDLRLTYARSAKC